MTKPHRGGKAPARRGRWLVALLGVVAVFLGCAASSASAHGLLTGFADNVYLSPDPGTRAAWLDRTQQETAGIVRLNVSWRTIATAKPGHPQSASDPAYDFSGLDAAVIDASSRGFRVMFTVYDAPKWAEGKHRADYAPAGTWKPNANAFGRFAHALASRYSGKFVDSSGTTLPSVRYYEAWNEPNLYLYLNPAWNSKKKPYSPTLYRRLLNAFYGGVKSAQHGAFVLGGATEPVGGDPGDYLGMRPLVFLRKMFCAKARRCTKPKLDALSAHPITNPGLGLNGGPRIHAAVPDDIFIADFHKLRTLLHRAVRAHHVGGSRHPQLWATEFWWVTQSPRQPYVIPRKVQARWIEVALYLLWKQGAQVAINFNIQDKPAFGSGVFTQKGKPKPSAETFRFPFVVTREHKQRAGVWTRPPASGRLEVQRRNKRGKWRTVKTLHVKRSAIVRTKVHIPKSAALRGKLGHSASLGSSASATAAAVKQLDQR